MEAAVLVIVRLFLYRRRFGPTPFVGSGCHTFGFWINLLILVRLIHRFDCRGFIGPKTWCGLYTSMYGNSKHNNYGNLYCSISKELSNKKLRVGRSHQGRNSLLGKVAIHFDIIMGEVTVHLICNSKGLMLFCFKC